MDKPTQHLAPVSQTHDPDRLTSEAQAMLRDQGWRRVAYILGMVEEDLSRAIGEISRHRSGHYVSERLVSSLNHTVRALALLGRDDGVALLRSLSDSWSEGSDDAGSPSCPACDGGWVRPVVGCEFCGGAGDLHLTAPLQL